MSKSALLFGVCLCLSACVFYTPTYVNNDQDAVVHYESTSTLVQSIQQETKEVSERVVQKVAKPKRQSTLAACGPFILPREAQKPKYLTDVDMLDAEDLPALDRMLGMKMKELQTHIDTLHSKYEQAHQRWLEVCMDKYSDGK